LPSISTDTLSITLKPDRFGSAQVNLTLTDSDGGKDWVWFWVNVTGQNDPPYISPKIPDQAKPEDNPEWVLDLKPYEHDDARNRAQGEQYDEYLARKGYGRLFPGRQCQDKEMPGIDVPVRGFRVSRTPVYI